MHLITHFIVVDNCKKVYYPKMKRTQLIKHLKVYGASLLREGSRHTIYILGERKTQIPRHNEIVDDLARKICKDIEIPFVR